MSCSELLLLQTVDSQRGMSMHSIKMVFPHTPKIIRVFGSFKVNCTLSFWNPQLSHKHGRGYLGLNLTTKYAAFHWLYNIPIFYNNVFYFLKGPYLHAIYSDHTHPTPSSSSYSISLRLHVLYLFLLLIVQSPISAGHIYYGLFLAA